MADHGSFRKRKVRRLAVAAVTATALLGAFAGPVGAGEASPYGGRSIVPTRPPTNMCGTRGMKHVIDPYYGAVLPDSDGDGLSDQYEQNISHTDPCDPDTDGDGLTDGCEVLALHSNPLDKKDPPPKPRDRGGLFPF